MASPASGISSGSSLLNNSGSEEDLKAVIVDKKRKRMISNRESARRSRMRKEKHLNELMAQVNQLKYENSQILTTLTLTMHNYSCVEAENSVLRTQMVELSNRLQSLNEMLLYLHPNVNNMNMNMNLNNSVNGFFFHEPQIDCVDSFIDPWNHFSFMNQPIMASADIMFQY